MFEVRKKERRSGASTFSGCHPESPRCLRGEGSAFVLRDDACRIMSTWLAKLGRHVTHSKQTTSHFLIDNFEDVFERASAIANFTYAFFNRQYQLLEPLVSHRKQRTEDFLIDKFCPITQPRPCHPSFPPSKATTARASSLEPPAPRNSNRPSPRLERPVSHRKQTIDPFSNRPYFAVCKIALLSALLPFSQLSTLDSQLWTS